MALLALLGGCGDDAGLGGIPCATDSDCAALDDGDLCNGRWRCTSGTCIPDLEPVSCTGGPCAGACNPETGECAPADGLPCNDKDPCTFGDTCWNGECVPGDPTCPDDENPCTVNSCQYGECLTKAAPNFTACDDGNPCTEGDTCLDASCNGKAVTCDQDEDPCTTMVCEPAEGGCAKQAAGEGLDCDDADPCTAGEVCTEGTCAGGHAKCAELEAPCVTVSCLDGECSAQPQADGAACDDGDACTDADTCQAGTCQPGEPTCAEPDNPCLVAVCKPDTGACDAKPAPAGTLCDDGDACTEEDACAAGTCAGQPKTCPSDGNPCTAAVCTEGGLCSQSPLPSGASCDDGDPCTASDVCDGDSSCVGSSACPDDGVACTLETCNPETGGCSTTELPDGAACDDGDSCTASEVCTAMVCGDGKPVVCPDDGDPCTLEICVADAGCTSVPAPDGSACDDSNPCTVGETCEEGVCGGGGLMECPDDGNACTTEICDPGGGCTVTPKPAGTACDDGNACTTATTCQGGECVGQPVVCAPQSPCHTAVCDTTEGCLGAALPNGSECEDSDACTLATTCNAGVCGGGTQVDCPQPGDPCISAACNGATGECETKAVPEGAPCNDQDPCTVAESCQAGSCSGGTPKDCGPGPGPCTALVCEAETGACVESPIADGEPCDTKNPCAGKGICNGGECSSKPTLSCPEPTEPCRVAVCNPLDGSCKEETAQNGAPCQDSDPCTAETVCLAGVCQGGTPTVCPDDGDSCTLEECTPGVGCGAKPALDGTPCDDSDPCTEETLCVEGACQGGSTASCPADGDSCTDDACQPTLGCTYPMLAPGSTCDDASACTTDDVCDDEGECKGTNAVSCPPSTAPCTVAVCSPETGECVAAPAADGKLCNDGNVCTTGDLCQNGTCTGAAVTCPQNDEECTVAGCDPATGKCVTGPVQKGVNCDDGLGCTDNDQCDGSGACVGKSAACPAPEDPCFGAACDESTGECAPYPLPNGSPCEDGNLCTSGDLCLAGGCVTGSLPTCLPSSSCETASCDPETGECSTAPLPNGSECEDDNPCTVGESCYQGACTGGDEMACPDDDNPCTFAACQKTTGQCTQLSVPDGATCSDLDGCTQGDVCTKGVCGGQPVVCEQAESKPCLTVACNPDTGECVESNTHEGETCDDLNLCTELDVCTAGECVGLPAICEAPDSDCLEAICFPDAGCAFTEVVDGSPCKASVCFVASTCAGGVCKGGKPLECNPSTDPCKVAFCTDDLGCTTGPADDGTSCEDHDVCTDTDACKAGECTGTAVMCPEPGPCQVAVCHPVTGCSVQPAPNGGPCDDDDPCTLDDLCLGGQCTGGVDKTCEGASPCMPEACNSNTGQCEAAAAPDGEPCDDDDPCSEATSCKEGTCGGGSVVVCPSPTSACLEATCSTAAGGCVEVPVPDGTPCNDGSQCTSPDVCASGSCTGSVSVFCPPPQGCLLSVCHPPSGTCAPTLAPDGAPCDDSDGCTVGETCTLGECGGSAASSDCCSTDDDCDDASPCTADACESGRCAHMWNEGLEACVRRIVIATAGASKLTILDATSLAPAGGTVDLPGTVRQLAVAPRAGLAYAAVAASDLTVQAIDPLQPLEAIDAPTSSGGGFVLAVDDALATLAVVQGDGVFETFDTRTGALRAEGPTLAPPVGEPALDPLTHRVYVPVATGWLAVAALDPLAAMPSSPWPVGGAPTRALHVAASDRLLLIDPPFDRVRVVGAQHGVGLSPDSISGLGKPAGLALDAVAGRVVIAYPAEGKIRFFDLASLAPASPPAASVPCAPQEVETDAAGRIYIGCAGAAKLHVLEGGTLTPVAGSPVDVPGSPSDIVVFHSHPGAVVITEAMINPTAVTDAHGEWIELTNVGSAKITLAGWTLETAASSHTIPGGLDLPVPPGGRIVLCRDAEPLTNGGVPCDYEYSGLSLPNDGTTLTLLDPSDLVVDEAALHAPIPAGKTLALEHLAFDNSRRYSWSTSNGTPGMPNGDVAAP